MSIFSTIFGSLWKLIKGLFESTKDAFEKLPKEQQDAILNGVQVSEIIKNNIGQGKAYVADLIAVKLGISGDIATGVVDAVTKDLGLDDFTNGLADKVEKGLTDLAHNSLFESIAKFAASFFGAGSVNWITLGLGVIEYAYQWLKGDGKLVQTPDRPDSIKATPKTDPTPIGQCPRGYVWNGTKCVKDVG